MDPSPPYDPSTADGRLAEPPRVGGDGDDFTAMFRAEFDYVVNSLRRLGVPQRDVDDLAHDVFVAVFRRRADYDRSRPVRPWLFAFAYRVASGYRRGSWSRRVVLDAPDDARDSTPDAAERIDAERNRALVLEALDVLDLDRRAVLVLADIDGVPHATIATALGIPVGTVASRLWHARKDFTAAVRRLRLKRGER